MEMRAFTAACPDMSPFETLVTGVGPMETSFSLTSRLASGTDNLQAVIHFGIAGAYLYSDDGGAGILDLCLAEEEVLGDLGICHQDRIEPFVAPELGVIDHFTLDKQLLEQATTLFKQQGVVYTKGRFVTVNCASGSRKRGDMLVRQFQGLCENMEGAAVVRVCAAFNLPCLELRCISNFVEDRDPNRWRLKEACLRAGKTAALIGRYLHERKFPRAYNE